MAEASTSRAADRAGAACAYAGCANPPWAGPAGGCCLHHSPDNGRDAESARRVWTDARDAARQEQSANYAGWHFPADPDGLGFESAVFNHGASFQDATFHGPARFAGTDFRDATVFDGAQFLTEASFEAATFHKFAAFDGVLFAGRVNFAQAAFASEAWFIGASFAGNAEFLGARFDSNAIFNSAVFKTDASFSNVVFRSSAHFYHAMFHGHALFSTGSSEVPSEAEFDLPSWELPWQGTRATPFAVREQGEKAYRLAKQSAQSRGDYRRAGEYHYAEQCAIHFGNRRQAGWKFWRMRFWLNWLEFLFARCLLGYGEKPARVLLAGLVVIVGWAGLYAAVGGIAPGGPGPQTAPAIVPAPAGAASPVRQPAPAFPPADPPPSYHPTFNECLHFSAVTFTTVGYGDYLPKPHCRLLADSEAFIGAALMAMFVVALTRKYMR